VKGENHGGAETDAGGQQSLKEKNNELPEIDLGRSCGLGTESEKHWPKEGDQQGDGPIPEKARKSTILSNQVGNVGPSKILGNIMSALPQHSSNQRQPKRTQATSITGRSEKKAWGGLKDPQVN